LHVGSGVTVSEVRSFVAHLPADMRPTEYTVDPDSGVDVQEIRTAVATPSPVVQPLGEEAVPTLEDVAVSAAGRMVAFPTDPWMQQELDEFIDLGAPGLDVAAGLRDVDDPLVVMIDCDSDLVRVASMSGETVTELTGGQAGQMLLGSPVVRATLAKVGRAVVVISAAGGVGSELKGVLRAAGLSNQVYVPTGAARVAGGRLWLGEGVSFQPVPDAE
jgi:hypothetical protein